MITLTYWAIQPKVSFTVEAHQVGLAVFSPCSSSDTSIASLGSAGPKIALIHLGLLIIL